MRFGIGSIVLSAALIVSGCGGGGSGSGTTSPPPTAPTVIAVTPTAGATGVAVTTTTVTATFSQAMNGSTISGSTFTLTVQGGAAVGGSVSYSAGSNTATFTPSASLAYGTTYTATITTGAQNSSGTALAANYTWSFTTASAPPPTVTAVTPANASTGIAITTAVTATFDQAMNSSTITPSTFTLVPQGGAAVSATVTYSGTGNVATLTPGATLAYNTTYTATITTGATASTGTALAANYTWTFTTAVAPPPTVSAVMPTNNSTGVAITTAVTATFNQAMNSSTITSLTFTLVAQGGAAVSGSVAYNAAASVATFTSATNLAYGTTYTATITTGAMSSAGTALASNFTWSFTTAAAPIPTVTSTVPANGVTSVNVSNALTATFSQPMNSSTITASTFTLAGPGNTAVAGLVTYNTGTSTATFTPNLALAYNTSYTATITTGATSAAGAALASNYVWTFTTGANPNQVTVDFGTTYQTIRGFGGSTAWLGQLTTPQATALFNQTNGLGLSILRVRIDPTGTSANGWVPTDGNWGQELTNAQEAKAANSNAIVIASPWTPPVPMKTSSASQPYYSGTCGTGGAGSNYCGGYLDPSNYAAYATYLEDFVTYFANGGVNLYAISMQNEPDYAIVNFESCYWTPQQMDTWVASLTANGATNPITPKLIMPESFQFLPVQSNTTLADPNAVGNVSIVGGHLYGVQPSYATNAEAANKEVWMTEHATCESNCPAPSIADALASAEEVHNSMTVGYYNAYVWWWIWNDPNDGVTYGLINSSTSSPAPTYYGYGIGQFSKFIQPGFVRVSATANPVSGVYVSAYTNSSPSHYVIVAINGNTASANLSFVLNNGSSITSLTPYQTTSSGGMAQQTAISVSSGQFTYTLPAQSIVTFVQ